MTTRSFSPSSFDPPDNAEALDGVGTADRLAELRDLLFGRERAELTELRERIEALGFDAEQVSRLLPEAIVLRNKRDKRLGKALMPTVEEAVRQSVSRNPKPLADAIFPVIGPAIRKAVSQAINGVVQALNSAIEHSVSFRGLKWRWEALRTGVPFAQIVLRHTLVFAVDQVFLIHRNTGLLLQHVAAPGSEPEDPDMVSGMLSAIQDFVSDSFNKTEGSPLYTFETGDVVIAVEHGPHAILAAAVRGHPPASLATVFQDALETVHLEYGDKLTAFDGDTEPLAGSRVALERCLRTQVADPGRRAAPSPVLWAVAAAVVILLAVWMFFHFRAERRWRSAVERLQAEPGLMVVEADRRGGRHFVSGLKDPLAPEPAMLIAELKVPIEDVEAIWEPYLSMEPTFVERRARELLDPPGSVSLGFQNGILSAGGSASDAWVSAARNAVRMIPGVSSFDEAELVNSDLRALQVLRDRIERERIVFPIGASGLTNDQDSILSVVVVGIERLRERAAALGRSAAVELIGRTDGAGSDAVNQRISRQRADAVLAALTARGVARTVLTAVGLGSAQPLPGGTPDDEARINRSVSFRVTIGEPAREPGSTP